MSQNNESENDIWEFKPLEKKRKKNVPSSSTKRRCTSKRSSKTNTVSSVRDQTAAGRADFTVKNSSLEPNDFPPELSFSKETVQTVKHTDEVPSCEDHCPICQMPFFLLVVQTPRWHVAECLDSSRDKCQECPDGFQCSSTFPNHYKRFNHTLLAHSRANGNTAAPRETQQAKETSCLQIPTDHNSCVLKTSQDSISSFSPSTNQAVSSQEHLPATPPSKLTNGLLLLRSPGPEDLKKKKGWSSSPKTPKSANTSQESKPVTPEESENQIKEDASNEDYFIETDEGISYSPLSEFPAETEFSNGCRKILFDDKSSENEGSMILFNDSSSSEDELRAEFTQNHLEVNKKPAENRTLSDAHLCPLSSSAPTNKEAAPEVEEKKVDCCDREKASFRSASEVGSNIQSPQSLVLERLKKSLLNTVNDVQILSGSCKQEQPDTPVIVSSQRSASMPPHKNLNKASQASGLKQTDIGVFFGLKPLKPKEPESGPRNPGVSFVPSAGGKSEQKRQRKSKGASFNSASQATGTVEDLGSVAGQGEVGKGRGWRRWNRVNTDGEVELPRCPFYKKIPGTKFAVDAFRYGDVQGITAYFLTHFHSDHYGGLTKNSKLPIYCNRITGNLVKSKLRVAEQYVHILPMNTEVTVEGVGVILLDANHCPGSAMFLFFLPDGQTVLHTGDFRADPSMESYPELLRRRVHTLYLDTTYCSPEYTFPRQQEVTSFAATTAFEMVTLNPRTLVVCGSYSVGKEKVFLALAEILGSKVCLSRDKYNTMCCLESEEIRKRITTDWKAAQVHVLPMMHLTFKKLQDYLARFSQQYNQLVAFKPTGWTFSQQVDSVAEIQPEIRGNISIYGIPYSEHSSFLELKRFVQWLKPLKIIPTVNVGSWASRKAMEKCFSEWISETKAKL